MVHVASKDGIPGIQDIYNKVSSGLQEIYKDNQNNDNNVGTNEDTAPDEDEIIRDEEGDEAELNICLSNTNYNPYVAPTPAPVPVQVQALAALHTVEEAPEL